MNGRPVREEVYRAYKERNEIEMMFDRYKTFMKGDVSCKQKRYVLEGRLFTNFTAMTAYYKLYRALRERKLLGTYSSQDIMEMSKAVYRVRIGGSWHPAELTAKVRKLLIKPGIDYLN
jgi:IS4 transposase